MAHFFQFWRLGFIVLGLTTLWVRAEEPHIDFSDAERVWIRENRIIPFGYDPQWQPFSYRDADGRFTGIDQEVLNRLARRLGVEFVPVHSASWVEAYRRAVSGEMDFLVSTAEAPERAQDFVFTRPYLSFPMALVARKEIPVLTAIDDLHRYRVASARGHVGTLALQRDYPDIALTITDTMEQAFLDVASGRADVVVTNVANANYIIKNLGLSHLKVAGAIPYLFQLRIAVRRDQPVLHGLLDKGIASLTPKERQEIVSPWVQVEYDNIIRWDYVMRWALGFSAVVAVVIGVISWHNRGLRRELEKRLRIQRELEAAQVRLERLNEEKAGLMRMAAHDLRNPLSAIMLNIEILRQQASPDGRAAFDRIMMLSHQMVHMIRNLLDVQALDEGSRRLRTEPLDLSAAAREAMERLEPAAQRKRITLRARFPLHLGEAVADRAALLQVIDNLVSNAVKYSPFDSLVTVEVAEGAEGCVAFRVSDEGPGIRPDEMSRLFQKYTCLSARPTGGEHSNGLGLAIVKQLVTAMGGRVWCESPPGEGATFIVELPSVAGCAVSAG